MTWMQHALRQGSHSARDSLYDCLLLLGLGLLLVATGIGLRDPWPADEPRFALIARDMVLTGDWWVPRVGGDIYADKPPLFFWFMAVCIQATHSLRASFLIPSLLSGLASTLLVYDLARRLWNRETGLLAGTLLLLTVQFVWQARQAQIDATLCFWTTLSLYGLLRHLLLGPQWRWYAAGWAAAGLGVITKGVGFLPLLVLIPFAALHASQWSPRFRGGAWRQWLAGPIVFALAIAVWLVPILLAARTDPALAAYRDEILFRQTIDRYAHAWQHREPIWYFILQVIPWSWLPLTLLLPWLIPQWRRALRSHDLRIALLLAWVALVVVFFSLSSGKRGVYVLPAVPAFVLAAAPFLADLLRKVSVQRVLFCITGAVAALCTLAAMYLHFRADKRSDIIENYDLDPSGPTTLIAILTTLVCVAARPHRGFAAFGSMLVSALLVVSFWVVPRMDAARSGRNFVNRIEQLADPKRELGILAFKEQYLLQLRRPIVHFGHARWREQPQEAFDAARWLREDPSRQLIVDEAARRACFATVQTTPLGRANRKEWFVVEGRPTSSCSDRGERAAAQTYVARSLR